MANKGGRPPKYDWKIVQLDYESGLSPADLHKKHEVPYNRLSEHIKKWEQSDKAQAIIRGFDKVSEAVSDLKSDRPDLAKNVMDIIVDRHPQFKKAMVALSSKIFNRALAIADNATASDLSQLSKAMQTTTDTLGVSQRHAKTEINNTNAVQTTIEVEIE